MLATISLGLAGAGTAGAAPKHSVKSPGPGLTVLGAAIADAANCPGDATEAYNADCTSGGDAYSLYSQARDIGADTYYAHGDFGQGVDVAMVDTGVAPVKGLTSGNVTDGLDISFESQAPNLRHDDTFGHGTHMASIIAGADGDPAATNPDTGKPNWQDATQFYGVAPKARLVSVKVADSVGAADVTQVIAAVDWVVQHRNDNGMHIRVLNLSYGLPPNAVANAREHRVDPLTFAVEQAWKAGIVVVAAAATGAHNGAGSLLAPAYDPPIVAVGAYDAAGTVGDHSDDKSADFTPSGSRRAPDVVAPGEHVLGLHARGSFADTQIAEDCAANASPGTPWNNPVFGPAGRFVRGRGTSQAAAVTSGVVALMLAQNTNLTPDLVKSALRHSARVGLPDKGRIVGKGELDAAEAYAMIDSATIPAPGASDFGVQGRRTIDLSRGGVNDALPCLTVASVRANAGTRDLPVPAGAEPGQWYGGVCSAFANMRASELRAAVQVDVRGNRFLSWRHALQSEIDRKTRTYVRGNGPWTVAPDGGEIWNGSVWSGAGWSDSAVLGRKAWNTVAWDGGDWMGNHFRGFDWSGHDFRDGGWTGSHFRGSDWLGSHFRGLSWQGSHLRDYSWQGTFWRDNAWA